MAPFIAGSAMRAVRQADLCPSTRRTCYLLLAQGHSPLLVPLVFRIMACHEQIKISVQFEIFMRRVAEREEFEPPVRDANNSFRGYRLQPLGHLSREAVNS